MQASKPCKRRWTVNVAKGRVSCRPYGLHVKHASAEDRVVAGSVTRFLQNGRMCMAVIFVQVGVHCHIGQGGQNKVRGGLDLGTPSRSLGQAGTGRFCVAPLVQQKFT